MSSETVTGSVFLDQILVGVIILILGAVGALIWKNKDKIRRKKKDFSFEIIKRQKHDSQKPSFESNMRSLRKISKVLNPQPVIFNETLWCGCKSKDKVIVKFCKTDKQRYIVMTYVPPEGYYVSEDVVLD